MNRKEIIERAKYISESGDTGDLVDFVQKLARLTDGPKPNPAKSSKKLPGLAFIVGYPSDEEDYE